MRKLPREIVEAMRARTARMALFAEVDHPAGYVRVWTGIGTLRHDGYDWRGIGALGAISGIELSSEIQIVEHAYTLFNVPPDNVGFINESIRGRKARAYIAFLTDSNKVIHSLIKIAETTLDVTKPQIADNGSYIVTLVGQTDLWQLERPLTVALSNTEQRKHFPNDSGFSEVVAVTTQRLSWTRV